MKIVILSLNNESFSTRRLVEEGKKRGHQIMLVDYLRCSMDITAASPKVLYKGDLLENVDAVIPRVGATYSFYGMAVVRQFQMMNVFCMNSSQSIARARDKLRCLQLLAKKGIGLPITGFAHGSRDTQSLIDLVNGTPLVIKLLEGTQGLGVVLAETDLAATSVIEAFRSLDVNILVQEYIKESGGMDIRAFVVGNKVVAAMTRKAREGEFRANIHRGASSEKVKLTQQERQLALQSAKTLGLNVAGVDLLRSNRGPLVLEVNSSPGLEGIEGSTQINVAGHVYQFIEDNFIMRRKRDDA